MKQVICIIFFLCTAPGTRAQEKKFLLGGRLGLGESRLSGIANATPKLALSGGISTAYLFTQNLGINAEFLLSSAGMRAAGSTSSKGIFGTDQYYHYKEKYDLVYAEVPVTGQLAWWLGDFFIRGYAGPSMNCKLMATQTRTYDDADYNNSHGFISKPLDQTNNIYYSAIYGAGIGARTNNNQLYFLDFRTSRALTPVGTINNIKSFSNYYCISGGYVF